MDVPHVAKDDRAVEGEREAFGEQPAQVRSVTEEKSQQQAGSAVRGLQKAVSDIPVWTAQDLKPSTFIDWNAPGSALNDHLRLQISPAEGLHAGSSTTLAITRPHTSSAAHQKPRLTQTGRAARGPKFAFGGRLAPKQVKSETGSKEERGFDSEGAIGQKLPVKKPRKADPWLSEWQPKPKPPGGEKAKPTPDTQSLSAVMTPPLAWGVPRTPQSPAAQSKQGAKDFNGKDTALPMAQKAKKSAPTIKQPRQKLDTLSAGKVGNVLTVPETQPDSPKEAAMKRLTHMRNLRRTHISASQNSVSSAAAQDSSPPSQNHKELEEGVSQEQPPEAAVTSRSAVTTEMRDSSKKPDAAKKDNNCEDHITESSTSQPFTPRRQLLLEKAKRAIRAKLPSFRRASTPLAAQSEAATSETTSTKVSADVATQDENAAEPNLQQCSGCGRKFNPKAFAVHSKICAKVFKSERATYAAEQAASRQPPPSGTAKPGGSEITQPLVKADRGSGRLLGKQVSITAVSVVASAPKHNREEVAREMTQQAGAKKKTPKWKQQSAQLRAAILATQPDKLGKAAASFPGAVIEEEEDSRVPCPHCGRKFAELTAERHIPKCKETVHKATRLAAGGGKAAHMRTTNQAKQGRR